eukprot:COSAG05_NODE_8345_length_712_cov_1.161501_1_plen_102_part_00
MLPVRKRIHCGTWRFCFCFFARIFLTRKVLWLGIFEGRLRAGWTQLTFSDSEMGEKTFENPSFNSPQTLGEQIDLNSDLPDSVIWSSSARMQFIKVLRKVF